MWKFLILIGATVTIFLSQTVFASGVVVPLTGGGGIDSEGNYYAPLGNGGMINAKGGYATPIAPSASFSGPSSSSGPSVAKSTSSVDKSTWGRRARNNSHISKVIGANIGEKAKKRPFKIPRGITFWNGKRIHAYCGGY